MTDQPTPTPVNLTTAAKLDEHWVTRARRFETPEETVEDFLSAASSQPVSIIDRSVWLRQSSRYLNAAELTAAVDLIETVYFTGD